MLQLPLRNISCFDCINIIYVHEHSPCKSCRGCCYLEPQHLHSYSSYSSSTDSFLILLLVAVFLQAKKQRNETIWPLKSFQPRSIPSLHALPSRGASVSPKRPHLRLCTDFSHLERFLPYSPSFPGSLGTLLPDPGMLWQQRNLSLIIYVACRSALL